MSEAIALGIIEAIVFIAIACVALYILGWIAYLFIRVLSGMFTYTEKLASSTVPAKGVRRETWIALSMAAVVVGAIFLLLQYGQ